MLITRYKFVAEYSADIQKTQYKSTKFKLKTIFYFITELNFTKHHILKLKIKKGQLSPFL